jgi:hypothetical protein
MKIETVKDLLKFAQQLSGSFDLSEKITLSDRFNEFYMSFEIDYSDGSIVIPISKVGSALEGTHRVLGKTSEKDEVEEVKEKIKIKEKYEILAKYAEKYKGE